MLEALALSHVARGGEHPQHTALFVLIDRRVIKNIRDALGHVPDGQRVIAHEAFGEHPLIALAGLVLLGEIVREIRADQLLAPHAGNLDGGFVYVGNLSFRADGDQRIERCLDQRTRILRGLFLNGHVARRGEHSQDVALIVAIHRGVVEHIHDTARGMADSQRVVLHKSLRKHLLVAFARFLRLGEVVGKVGPDQLLARHAGSLDGGFVYVGNLSLPANGDQRVERGFNQGTRIRRRGTL